MFWGGQVKQFFARGKQTARCLQGTEPHHPLNHPETPVYLLTGTISMDELKQAAEAIQ